MTKGALDALLEGFTGAGLWAKSRLPDPPTTYRSAMIALSCGFATSLAVYGGIYYFVVHGYQKTANVLLGTLVLVSAVRLVRVYREKRSSRERPTI